MFRKNLIVVWMLLCLWVSAFAGQDYITKDSGDGADSTLHVYNVDLDDDKQPEEVKVMYGPGVSDKYLEIEVYKSGKLVSKLKGEFGIQSNYKVEDVDKDGRKEIIIWSGIWDPRMPGENGVTEETCEGHSAPHRYIVATYKLIRGQYYLWDVYTTKKKYNPFCEEMPGNNGIVGVVRNY